MAEENINKMLQGSKEKAIVESIEQNKLTNKQKTETNALIQRKN